METWVIQLPALRKPVVTVHLNELYQRRKCCLYCGVAVCLVKHLPVHTEAFFFLRWPFLCALEECWAIPLFLFFFFLPLTLQVENEF